MRPAQPTAPGLHYQLSIVAHHITDAANLTRGTCSRTAGCLNNLLATLNRIGADPLAHHNGNPPFAYCYPIRRHAQINLCALYHNG